MGTETSTSYRRPHRPLPVRLLNAAGRAVAHAGVRPGSLAPPALLAAARQRAKLDDFGGDGFREPLALLCRSLEEEASLHPLGRLMARENLVRILAERLRLVRARAEDPGMAATDIGAPVFITGLQRTGTTLLNRLLAVDPAFRPLASWEAVSPVRPQGRGRGGADPRRRQTRVAELSLRYLAPDFFAVHPVEADAPEEDCLLFDYSLRTTVVEAIYRLPSYSAWLMEQDPALAYAEYREVLRLLTHQGAAPGWRWILKTPYHLENLDTLLAVFPGAKIIWTHRDPATTLASFCSMICHGRGVFSDVVDPYEVGREWQARTAHMVERGMQARARADAGLFCDVDYRALVADPMAQVERIYGWLGMPLAAGTRAKMERFLGENRKHRHGVHHYRLEDFGLDARQVHGEMAEYMQRHDLAPKD